MARQASVSIADMRKVQKHLRRMDQVSVKEWLMGFNDDERRTLERIARVADTQIEAGQLTVAVEPDMVDGMIHDMMAYGTSVVQYTINPAGKLVAKRLDLGDVPEEVREPDRKRLG